MLYTFFICKHFSLLTGIRTYVILEYAIKTNVRLNALRIIDIMKETIHVSETKIDRKYKDNIS